MSDHERHWNDLLASEDPRIALREHFEFLTDDPTLGGVLDEIFERFEGADVEDDRLVVSFEDDFELRCDPPADEIGPDVPASYARMAEHHDYLALEAGFSYGSFWGVGEDGGLLTASLTEFVDDPDLRHAVDGSEEGAVLTAIEYFADEFVFSAAEETASGEMAVYYLPHETCEPHGPVSRDLDYSEVFLLVILGHVLDREFFSEGERRLLTENVEA